ncbi:hypothetical protein GCM10009785_17740 [Brooklawnia cerclae]|uniref:DivIVA domain-containing protein n=1 Tax=Brooklawnia cerclae TaxID=349934 RepID=A0ABX0SI53_9ACTN|nr:DivIVA domain-containing protein [Brooklawnia cerclae]NIH57655.1 DivIVA domain-containing protein [Brooklawnia cerclae]
MGWVFAALIVVVIGLAFVASAGRLGEMPAQVDDRPVPALPQDRPLRADDLDDLRFAVVTRGYSMDQVDAFVARLRDEMTGRTPDENTEADAPSDEGGAATEFSAPRRAQSGADDTPRWDDPDDIPGD